MRTTGHIRQILPGLVVAVRVSDQISYCIKLSFTVTVIARFNGLEQTEAARII